MELAPVFRKLDGDFVYMRSVLGNRTIGKFSGIVEAPGVEGNLAPLITIRATPMTDQAEALRELAA